MPQSGRSTVSRALCQIDNYRYIDAATWIKSSFRQQKPHEHIQKYEDEYHTWMVNRIKNNPDIIIDNVKQSISAYNEPNANFVIDGIFSPRDLAALFDFNKDVVVFLDRTNNSFEYKDYENIGVSVNRDYCFWLSSADLLPKNRWIEFKFHIPGEETDAIRMLGSKNSVFIVKSLNKVISKLKELLFNLQVHQSSLHQ